MSLDRLKWFLLLYQLGVSAGAMLIAAEMLGRDWTGCRISVECVEAHERRINSLLPQVQVAVA